MPTEKATLELVAELTGFLRDIKRGQDRFEAAVDSMQKALNRLDAGESVEDIEALSREAKEAGDDLTESMRRAGRSLENLGDEAKEAGGDFDKLNRDIDGVQAEVTALDRRVRRLGSTTDRETARMRAGTRAAGRGFAALRGQVAAVVGVIAAIGIGRFFREVTEATAQYDRATAGLNARLAETGGTIAGQTLPQLLEYASALQSVTRFNEETIIGAETLLSTFLAIDREDIFQRAIESAADMAEVVAGQTGGAPSLTESVIRLGKALQDPIRGTESLRDVGVSLTEQQRDQVKALVEANRLYEAQTIILDELDVEFKNIARSQVAGLGVLDQLGNSIDDILKSIGQAGLAEEIARIATAIKSLAESEEGAQVAREIGQALATIAGAVRSEDLEAIAGLAAFLSRVLSVALLLGTGGVRSIGAFVATLRDLFLIAQPGNDTEAALERIRERAKLLGEQALEDFNKLRDGFSGAADAIESGTDRAIPALTTLGEEGEAAGEGLAQLGDEAAELEERALGLASGLDEATASIQRLRESQRSQDDLSRQAEDLRTEIEKLDQAVGDQASFDRLTEARRELRDVERQLAEEVASNTNALLNQGVVLGDVEELIRSQRDSALSLAAEYGNLTERQARLAFEAEFLGTELGRTGETLSEYTTRLRESATDGDRARAVLVELANGTRAVVNETDALAQGLKIVTDETSLAAGEVRKTTEDYARLSDAIGLAQESGETMVKRLFEAIQSLRPEVQGLTGDIRELGEAAAEVEGEDDGAS